jgi:hypothetical protein
MLGLILCASAPAQQRTGVIDLNRFGFPPAVKSWNPDSCTVPYRGYHGIEWLDNEHVVAIFNTNPVCPPDAKDAFISGVVRIVVVSITGEKRAQRDIPYVADLWQSESQHNGLAIGLGGTVMVVVHGVPWASVPNADGMVRVFTRNLEPLQEILTETALTTMEYKTFTHFGIHFEGVTLDHSAVVFSEDTGIGKPQKCLLFTGTPLKQVAECPAEILSQQRKKFDAEAPYPVSDHDIPSAFLGRSADMARSTAFFVGDRPICDLVGTLCPGKGTLVVYETQTKKAVFRKKFSLDAAIALSPDGRKIASFRHNKVEIISLP